MKENRNTDEIIISVVMPTYNSEPTIEKSLSSIRGQNFEQSRIEIIVVDGGSNDRTLEIANKYRSIILYNPERLPEAAKLIGVKAAKGHFLFMIDSDEVICDNDSFNRRIEFMTKNKEIHGAYYDLKSYRGYNPICTYMNDAGDPFSCFTYKRWGNTKYNLKRNLIGISDFGNIYHFNDLELIPIGDSNTVMDLDYIRSKHPQEAETYEPAVLWDIVIRDNGLVGWSEKDFVYHLSACDFKTYLKKLKFRVVNNIHDVKGSGYSFRAQNDKTLSRRKYLYPFYCISIVLPILDGIRMSILHKNMIFMLHPIFAWYVMLEIVIQYIKKLVGARSTNTSYGK